MDGPRRPGNTWYRVVTVTAGRPGTRSDPQYVGAAQTVLTDRMEASPVADGHSGVDIRPGS
jgi:hypothetical protein